MPDSWLANTPFTGWALPGVALLIRVAVPQLVTAALIAAGGRRGTGSKRITASSRLRGLQQAQ